IAEGGIFIHGGPGLRGEESVARVVLPLEALSQLLQDSQIPGTDAIPAAEGEIALRIAATPENGIDQWQFDAAITGDQMRAQIEGYEDLPSVDMAWNLDGHLDLVANALHNLSLGGHLIGFETRIVVEQLPFDRVAQPIGLRAEATLD